MTGPGAAPRPAQDTDGGSMGSDDGDGDRPAGGARRTPDQERRAAERARRIRESRAAERSEPAEPTGRRRRTGRRDTAATAVRERTAARTAEQKRTRDPRYRRRRAFALLTAIVVMLIGLSAAGWWALAQYGPGVASVAVTGTRQIPVQDVEDAVAVDPGIPLAAVDTGAVTARVSAIPGVATVDVGRSWPDTLSVAVTERTPAALAETPEGLQLIDASGLAYRAAPPDVRLPRLQLPTVAPDDPATLAAVAVLQALGQPVREQVQTLSLGEGGSTFELGLTDDRRVMWGPWADAAATPQRAAVLGPLLGREGAVYDVSSPALVTVRAR